MPNTTLIHKAQVKRDLHGSSRQIKSKDESSFWLASKEWDNLQFLTIIYELLHNSLANTSMYPVRVWVQLTPASWATISCGYSIFPIFPSPDGLLKCCIIPLFLSSSPWLHRELQVLAKRHWECQLWNEGERKEITSFYMFSLLLNFFYSDCFHTLTVTCDEWDIWSPWPLTRFYKKNIYICTKIHEYTQRYVSELVKYMCANPCIHSHRKPPKREMENNCLVPLNVTLKS